jgi:cupin 2 domain-containing protein
VNNLFESIPQNLDNEVFEQLVESGGVSIERIISKGHTSPKSGWYDQEQHEWVVLLKGNAVIAFADKSSVTLRAGDYISIKAHEKHRVEWTDPEIETIWLAVHFD